MSASSITDSNVQETKEELIRGIIDDICNQHTPPYAESGPVQDTKEELIRGIIDDICNQHTPPYAESGSQCELRHKATSSTDYVDNRLIYWKNMIQERRRLHRRLCRGTGRQQHELLMNKDNREEQVISRILDQLRHSEGNCTCSERNAEQDHVEAIGVPNHVRSELNCVRCQIVRNTLDFYPHIEELEMLGHNIWRRLPCVRTSGHTISSITSLAVPERVDRSNADGLRMKSVQAVPSILSLNINGTTFRQHRPEFSPIVERVFVCNPFEYCLRMVIRVENNGREPMNFKWEHVDFFSKHGQLFSKPSEVFLFDIEPFELWPGAVREVTVFFRPQKVGIVKQRWLLKTCPSLFFRYPFALTLNIHGRCTPPLEYVQRLDETVDLSQQSCCRNAVYGMKRKAEPMTFPKLCPYIRELEEAEAFNQRNVSFHCDSDVEVNSLKQFFHSVKPVNCHAEWDYSVSLLIELVCCQEDERLRVDLIGQLQSLLTPLRGRTTPLKLCDSADRQKQRQRTKFIFVRGIISNNIELWEEKTWELAARMLKQTKDGPRRRPKFFRDALYLYTYNQLCDIAENIVSVIESTEHV